MDQMNYSPSIRYVFFESFIGFFEAYSIRNRALSIPLGDDWWIHIHLPMHGHVVVISRKEFALIEDVRLMMRSLTWARL